MNQIKHAGASIVELSVQGLDYAASVGLIREFADSLKSLKPGRRVNVLMDLENSTYDPRQLLVWKSYMDLFSEKVGKSAVIGASGLQAAAIHGVMAVASLAGKPLKGRRAVIFKSRAEALDFLAEP